MLGGQELLFALNHALPRYDSTVPLVRSLMFNQFLVLGFANGTIRVYNVQNDDSFVLYSHIDTCSSSNASQSLITNMHVFKLEDDISSLVGEYRLAVSFEDGIISSYSFPSGIIRDTVRLPFACRGLDCDFELQQGVEKGILVWGQSHVVCVLDRTTLKILTKIDASLSNWPIPVSLFNDQLLLVSRAGEASIWKVLTEHKTVLHVQDFAIQNLITVPTTTPERVDLVIQIIQIDAFLWVVVQRHGWTIFRWNVSNDGPERFIRETGSTVDKPLVYAFRSRELEQCFGAVADDGTVYFVNMGQLQIIDPSWQGSFIDVCYRDSRLWAIVDDQGSILAYYTNIISKTTQIEWNSSAVVVERAYEEPVHYQHSQSSLTGMTTYNENFLVVSASKGVLYTFMGLDTWIKNNPQCSCEFSDSRSEVATVLDLHLVGLTNVITLATSHGRVLQFRLEHLAESAPLLQLIGKADSLASLAVTQLLVPQNHTTSSLTLCMDINVTISVLDTNTGSVVRIIPGYNFAVKSASTTTVESANLNSSTTYLTVGYENGVQKCWNLTTGKAYSPEEVGTLTSKSAFKDTPFVDCTSLHFLDGDSKSTSRDMVFRPNPYLSVIASSQATYNHAETSALISVFNSRACGIAVRDTNISCFSTTYLNNDMNHDISDGSERLKISDGYCSLMYLCGLASFNKTASIEELLKKFLVSENLPSIDTVSEFITTRCRPGSKVYLCCRKLIEKLLKLQQGAILQRGLVEKWQRNVPSQSTGDIYSEKSLRCLLVVVALCRVFPADYKNRKECQRQVADSLMMYLNESCPRLYQEIAIEVIGKDWDLWEKYFNPLYIVNTLVSVLIQNGFCKLSRKSFMEMDSWNYGVQNCTKCLQNVAFHNVVLLLSSLTTNISDETRSSDTRIASLKVLTFLIAYPLTQVLVGPHHLSSIVTPVVKCLDTSEGSSTDVPESASSSLITEATLFLSTLINIYPDYMAFHRGQQRLAVSLIPEHLTPTFRGIMAFVYDLRTGTLVSSLGVDYSATATKIDAEGPVKISTVLPGSVCENIAFAPDGKHLAAIIRHISDIDMPASSSAKDRAVTIAVWRISFGIMSLFQAFATVSTSTHPSVVGSSSSSSSSQKESQIGSIIKPVSLSLCRIKVAEYFNFRWQSDKSLLLESDVSTKAVKITI